MLATLLDELGITRLAACSSTPSAQSTDRAALHRRPARGARPGQAPDVRGQPAPRRNQSAARARLQGPERPGPHQRAAEDRRLPRRRLHATHFAQVLAALDACGVPYTVNPRLVRGLDYYTRTTFEFTVPDGSGLGTQNALLGGGRYDGLSEMLGGPRAPGIGFAIGEDRLILTLQAQAAPKPPTRRSSTPTSRPWASPQNPAALALARELRRAGLSVEVGDGTFRLKKSFEAADKRRPPHRHPRRRRSRHRHRHRQKLRHRPADQGRQRQPGHGHRPARQTCFRLSTPG